MGESRVAEREEHQEPRHVGNRSELVSVRQPLAAYERVVRIAPATKAAAATFFALSAFR